MKLAEFNAADPSRAADILKPCLDVPRWVEAVAASRPFATRDALLACAAKAANPLSAAEVESALAHHPRIGERPTAGTTEASMSRAEQSGVDPADADAAESLARLNRDYEDKFGRVFLIRASGRTGPQILAELERRLGNDFTAERDETVQQLREIALLRLGQTVGE